MAAPGATRCCECQQNIENDMQIGMFQMKKAHFSPESCTPNTASPAPCGSTRQPLLQNRNPPARRMPRVRPGKSTGESTCPAMQIRYPLRLVARWSKVSGGWLTSWPADFGASPAGKNRPSTSPVRRPANLCHRLPYSTGRNPRLSARRPWAHQPKGRLSCMPTIPLARLRA